MTIDNEHQGNDHQNNNHQNHAPQNNDPQQHPLPAAGVQQPISPTKTQAPSPNYQEQPNAHEALEQAITSVPLKNYSDYEITIETKTHYADALFTDDDELDQALSNQESPARPEQATEQTTEQASTEVETIDYKDQAEPETVAINFSVFLTPSSYANPLAVATTPIQHELGLSVAPAGLNDSPISDLIDFEDNDQTRALLLDTAEPITVKPEPGAAKSKSLAEKIKQQAKAQLDKSRTQFDEYTGRSLLARELPLGFSFPPLKPKKEFDTIVSGYEIRKLFAIKGKSNNAIFKQADTDLAKVVKCQLSSSNRLSLLDAYSEPLFAKTKEVAAMFERKPSALGDDKRLQLAELTLNTLKHLITGYKQVYASFYEAANILYGPQRNTANNVVFRLIDLLVLEQLLTTALQSPLPSGSIKTFNTLFCALSLYESQLITQPQQSLALGERSSIKALYLRYQVGLAFDFMPISSSLHKALNPYIYQNLGLLSLLPLQQTIAPTAAAWVICHDSNAAPNYCPVREITTEPLNREQFPAAVIEVNRFFNAIKKDYAECIALLAAGDKAAGDKKHSSKILAAIKIPYATTIMSEINHSVALIESKGRLASYSIYQSIQCKAYLGLESCISYFDYQYALNTKKPVKKGEPVKDMPPKPVPAKGEWLCAMQDENFFYLQTDEGKVSAPLSAALDVGHLLLLVIELEGEGDGNEQSTHQTQLTRIVRMERGQQGKLNFIAELISTQITHARISTESTNNTAVLLAIKGDSRLLITDYKQSYYSGNSIALSLPDATESVIAIDNVMTITQKLQCLTLR